MGELLAGGGGLGFDVLEHSGAHYWIKLRNSKFKMRRTWFNEFQSALRDRPQRSSKYRTRCVARCAKVSAAIEKTKNIPVITSIAAP